MAEQNSGLTEHEPTVESPDEGDGTSSSLIAYQERHSGPLPHPAILAGYNQIVPGAAERIIQMAEKNQMHQIDIEGRALDAAKRDTLLGQVFALAVSLSAFGTSIVAMSMGHPTVAAVIGGTTVVGLATAFIVGRRPNQSAQTESAKNSGL